MNRLYRGLLIAVGTVSVGLGVLGILLPVLPTTPFLLLAAWCYARSSERFHLWLLSNRWFGGYIRNFREGRGMPLRQKAVTLAILWVTAGFTVAVVLSAPWARAAVLLIAGAVSVYLVRLRPRGTDRDGGLDRESG
jgi:uncharacterized membrane protein YbaN (DUF454 family)